ncbi:MAG TPA: heat-inducible transcriptional repressor HrcA [Candidatus Limnocylindrales bacterium]|nr:heat-inducible transcriptional repressor HrcA [Candidatus Limnocylindrales bacterium]
MARRKDRPGPLDLRSAAILRAVIEEHVATAQPVGSVSLVEKHRLGVSPATVRNVMAELERAGYLGQPHTSAGRVPTDAGYRLYVEGIADTAPLEPVEQLMIRHQFGQVEFASEQWFRLAAATLAGTTHAAGLATPAKAQAARVRRVDLVAAGERMASLVLVFAEGPVKQLLIPLDEPLAQEVMDEAARRLNERFGGRVAAEIERRLPSLERHDEAARLAVRAAERIVKALKEFDASAVEDVFSEGLLNVLAEPEFAQSDKVRRIFAVLQDRTWLAALVVEVVDAGDVRVYIGTENEPVEMRDVSLVLAPYGRPGRATGVVGVLGPTRLSYPHAISTVRYVSGLMNELVDHLYA